MERMIGNARLELIHGDLTLQAVDAIVNAANSSLLGGGGVDGAIHRAGGPAILAECRAIVAKIGRLPTGQAAITTGGDLPAKHVIHTVGPVWPEWSERLRVGESERTTLEPSDPPTLRRSDELLAGAYRESLKVAVANGLRSVAFPSISTGAYRFPVDRAARIALATVKEMLSAGAPLDLVRFVLFDERTLAAYEAAMRSTFQVPGSK